MKICPSREQGVKCQRKFGFLTLYRRALFISIRSGIESLCDFA
jgi:hypothetical protein